MMIKTAEEALAVMAQVYTDHPELFAKGAGARDKNGEQCHFPSNEAVSFDAAGFIRRMEANVQIQAINLLSSRCEHLYALDIIGTNDALGREEIIKACLYKSGGE